MAYLRGKENNDMVDSVTNMLALPALSHPPEVQCLFRLNPAIPDPTNQPNPISQDSEPHQTTQTTNNPPATKVVPLRPLFPSQTTSGGGAPLLITGGGYINRIQHIMIHKPYHIISNTTACS